MRRSWILMLVTMASVAAIVFLLFPILFDIHVDVPSKVQFATASSMMFQISNQNLTPVTDIAYTCEVARFILADGSAVKDANVVSRGNVRKISGRHAAAGRCQTGYFVAAPVQTAEYRVTVTYRLYPWPERRTRVWRISAEFNSKREVTGWKAQ